MGDDESETSMQGIDAQTYRSFWAELNDMPDYDAYRMYREAVKESASDRASRARFNGIRKAAVRVARGTGQETRALRAVKLLSMVVALLALLLLSLRIGGLPSPDMIYQVPAQFMTNALYLAMYYEAVWSAAVAVAVAGLILAFASSVYCVHRRDRVVHRLTVIAWVGGIPESSLVDLAEIVRSDGHLEDVLYWWDPTGGRAE